MRHYQREHEFAIASPRHGQRLAAAVRVEDRPERSAAKSKGDGRSPLDRGESFPYKSSPKRFPLPSVPLHPPSRLETGLRRTGTAGGEKCSFTRPTTRRCRNAGKTAFRTSDVVHGEIRLRRTSPESKKANSIQIILDPGSRPVSRGLTGMTNKDTTSKGERCDGTSGSKE